MAPAHTSDCLTRTAFLEIDWIISLMVRQVSDSRERSRVFEQLFDDGGPLFCFGAAASYV